MHSSDIIATCRRSTEHHAEPYQITDDPKSIADKRKRHSWSATVYIFSRSSHDSVQYLCKRRVTAGLAASGVDICRITHLRPPSRPSRMPYMRSSPTNRFETYAKRRAVRLSSYSWIVDGRPALVPRPPRNWPRAHPDHTDAIFADWIGDWRHQRISIHQTRRVSYARQSCKEKNATRATSNVTNDAADQSIRSTRPLQCLSHFFDYDRASTFANIPKPRRTGRTGEGAYRAMF